MPLGDLEILQDFSKSKLYSFRGENIRHGKYRDLNIQTPSKLILTIDLNFLIPTSEGKTKA